MLLKSELGVAVNVIGNPSGSVAVVVIVVVEPSFAKVNGPAFPPESNIEVILGVWFTVAILYQPPSPRI